MTDLLTMVVDKAAAAKLIRSEEAVEKREIKGEILSPRILQPSLTELTNHSY